MHERLATSLQRRKHKATPTVYQSRLKCELDNTKFSITLHVIRGLRVLLRASLRYCIVDNKALLNSYSEFLVAALSYAMLWLVFNTTYSTGICSWHLVNYLLPGTSCSHRNLACVVSSSWKKVDKLLTGGKSGGSGWAKETSRLKESFFVFNLVSRSLTTLALSHTFKPESRGTTSKLQERN